MHTNSYTQVFDGANRRIRGLWQRNGSFYVQTRITDAGTGIKKIARLPLKDAKTPIEAKQAMAVLLSTLAETGTIHGKSGPTFQEYQEHYNKVVLKAEKTKHDENLFLNQWQRFLGSDTKITNITPINVLAYRAELQKRNLSPRTINLHTRALKQLLYLARTEGYIRDPLPTAGVKQMKEKHTEKELLSSEEIISMGTEALLSHDRTGSQFANFLLLSMYSGGRVSETLKLKWSNIDWINKQLVFVSKDTKSGQTRRVNFNRNLENHLLCMKTNNSESDFLFPSFRTDQPVTSFKTIFSNLRNKLGMDTFTFHSLRHFFISQCVMLGVDYLSIARWVGHKDGGVLIGKIYGHLNDAHLKLQASKLTF